MQSPTEKEKTTTSKFSGLTNQRSAIVKALHDKWAQSIRLTAKDMRELSKELGVDDLYWFWEVAETAWTLWYRKIIREAPAYADQYPAVVDFYHNVQPAYNNSSSETRMYQQYSTSAPLAYCAAEYLGEKKTGKVFEPSAGNGLLLIGVPTGAYVNELSTTRKENLQFQNIYKKVTGADASLPFDKLGYRRTFDAVLSNPPFGPVIKRDRNQMPGLPNCKLELYMLALALETMKDDGRAVFVVGGWTEFAKTGGSQYKIKNQRSFYNWLYRNYYVDDIININSRKLYNKQGTAHFVRMILISGRKEQPFGEAPDQFDAPELTEVISDFYELRDRFRRAITKSKNAKTTLSKQLSALKDILRMELNK